MNKPMYVRSSCPFSAKSSPLWKDRTRNDHVGPPARYCTCLLPTLPQQLPTPSPGAGRRATDGTAMRCSLRTYLSLAPLCQEVNIQAIVTAGLKRCTPLLKTHLVNLHQKDLRSSGTKADKDDESLLTWSFRPARCGRQKCRTCVAAATIFWRSSTRAGGMMGQRF